MAIVTEDALVCRMDLMEFQELMAHNSALNFEITKLIGLKFKKIQTKFEHLIYAFDWYEKPRSTWKRRL